MQPWWKKWPDRLDFELAELEKVGISYEVDKQAFKNGIVVLNVLYEIDARKLNLVVRFPDVYPYFRFEIYAPELKLDHHQNPFEKNLCMIGRATSNWSTSDTLAKYITSRLTKVIQAGESTDPYISKQLEEEQGEPISHYYAYAPNHFALIDSSWSIDPSVYKGVLTLGIDKFNSNGLNFAVLTVKDNDKNILVQAEPEISNLYPDKIEGKWVRSYQPIIENNQNRFFNHLLELDRTLDLNNKNILLRKILIIGILFPEEVSWRDNKDGWLFFILRQKRG